MINKTKTINILLLVIFSLSLSFSQSETATLMASVEVEHPINSSVRALKENKNVKIKSNIYYDISDVDFSTRIDILSNTLDFSGGDNHKFTKMQLTHKASNKTILSRQIEKDYKIHLDKIVPGTYFLILSNKKGTIKTEEITII